VVPFLVIGGNVLVTVGDRFGDGLTRVGAICQGFGAWWCRFW